MDYLNINWARHGPERKMAWFWADGAPADSREGKKGLGPGLNPSGGHWPLEWIEVCAWNSLCCVTCKRLCWQWGVTGCSSHRTLMTVFLTWSFILAALGLVVLQMQCFRYSVYDIVYAYMCHSRSNLGPASSPFTLHHICYELAHLAAEWWMVKLCSFKLFKFPWGGGGPV